MPIVFDCECGEKLTVEDAVGGRRAFCPKCRKSVAIPPSSDAVPAYRPSAEAPGKGEGSKGEDPYYEGEILEPQHLDRVKDKRGVDCFKLTCYCGKRILSPLHPDLFVGRCPKCGRRLRLPGYRPPGPGTQRDSERSRKTDPDRPTPPTPGLTDTVADMEPVRLDPPAVAPAAAAAPAAMERPDTAAIAEAADAGQAEFDPGNAHPEDDVGTIVMEPLSREIIERETHANREAAIRTADRLRRHKVSASGRVEGGLVSAWPLAGRGTRAIAGFIDLTLCTVAAGSVVILGHLGALPPGARHVGVAIAAFLTAGLLNDVLLEVTGGGLGKRLAVLTLRRRDGKAPSVGVALGRALVKWLVIPGWLVALVDPAERALHDLLFGTLVLKGRSRHG
ncbi:MAG: RDD family protein [Planctomycetes bacterium]|nr:RDD family protein [Planctomycetota bacterium]